MELKHVNTIDTLDKLLGVDLNAPTKLPMKLDYYKLWLRIVLEQKECKDKKEDLEKIERGLSSLCNDKLKDSLEEYLICQFLLHICLREMLKWKESFDILTRAVGYLEYSKVRQSYLWYLFGRLFYDIQEYCSDYMHIKREFVNWKRSDLMMAIDFYNFDKIETQLQVICPNEKDDIKELFCDQKSDNDESTALHKLLAIADFFFNKALKEDEKEHYYAWMALTHQKKGIVLFYSYKYENSIQELNVAIRKYNSAIIRANRDITNLYFNLGLCYFYLEMIYLFSEDYKDRDKAISNFEAACLSFTKSINCTDESYVKNEYTFRRGILDVYYYRLIAYRDYIKESIGITSEKSNVLNQKELVFIFYMIEFLKKLDASKDLWRVEYLVSLAKIVDYLNSWIPDRILPVDNNTDYWDAIDLITRLLNSEKSQNEELKSLTDTDLHNMAQEVENFIRDGYITLSEIKIMDIWQQARELDIRKFEWPFRFGLAFNAKQYETDWKRKIGDIMSELRIKDLSEHNYELYQNPKIAEHYSKVE